MNGIEELATQLLSQIHTTAELKKISLALETLSQSDSFKKESYAIASDAHLTAALKRNQLLYLFRQLQIPLLTSFFEELLAKNEFWLFSSKQFDYFDQLVRHFQLLTEKILIVNLVTAIEILPLDLERLAADLSKSLGKQVILHPQVNPTIMGGAQIRVGNLVFDYSLRSKFGQFGRQWLAKMGKTSELVGRE